MTCVSFCFNQLYFLFIGAAPETESMDMFWNALLLLLFIYLFCLFFDNFNIYINI